MFLDDAKEFHRAEFVLFWHQKRTRKDGGARRA